MSVDAPPEPTTVPLPVPAPPRRRWWRSRGFRWVLVVLLTATVVLVPVAVLFGSARSQRADDPRSTQTTGSGALGQLLTDEGVRVRTTSSVDDLVGRSTTTTTIVVADAEELSVEDASRVAQAPHARLVLLRPTLSGLRAFGVGATPVAPPEQTVPPACADPVATRAGAIRITRARAAYRSEAPAALACYPTGDGYAWLRATSVGGPVDLVAGGLSNGEVAEAGNAAFGLNLLGSQPDLVWLMARPSTAGPAATEPGLLPDWWTLTLVQFGVALVAVAIWRGRRLGPIMTEPLPVRVRAAETVEGHGRLYQRVQARDRAAEALRDGTRRRLAAAYGHADDPDLLAGVLADRTGWTAAQLRAVLAGPPPPTDEGLLALATDLDRLEQEARLR